MSRLKKKILALMMAVGRALRSVSGYPLTLKDVKSVKVLTVTGADGGVGDKTLNLLTMKDSRSDTDWTLELCELDGIKAVLSGTISTSGGRNGYLSEPITLESGKTYTLAWYYVSGSYSGTVPKVCLNKTTTGGYYCEVATYARNYCYTFTASADVEVRMGINHTAGAVYDNYCGYIALYEGSYTNNTLPEFKPCGYEIPLLLSGDGEARFSLYSSQMLGAGDVLSADFEEKTAQVSGSDVSGLQVWDDFPMLWTGTVIVSADTEILPSQMSAVYYVQEVNNG